MWSKAALTAPKTDFRFTPESGLSSDISPCPKSAMCGQGRGPADCHSGNCPTETVDPPGDVLWSAHGDQINEVGNARCRTEFSPQASRSSRMPTPIRFSPRHTTWQRNPRALNWQRRLLGGWRRSLLRGLAPPSRRRYTDAWAGGGAGVAAGTQRVGALTNPAKINRGHPSVTPSNLGL